MPDTVLGARDTVVKKRNMVYVIMELMLCQEEAEAKIIMRMKEFQVIISTRHERHKGLRWKKWVRPCFTKVVK